MHRIGLLAKLAFIGNLFFLLCIWLQSSLHSQQSQLVSVVAILGLIIGMGIANPASNIANGIVLARRGNLFTHVPRWLAGTNFLFLLLQIFYLLHTWL